MSRDEREVVVVGGGLAGACAAHGALESGARDVLVVCDGDGATGSCAGWLAHEARLEGEALSAEALALRPWGAYRFATAEGFVVDAASGVPELLDLASLREGPLAVADLGVGARWQPDFVAASLRPELGRDVVVLRPAEDTLGAASLLQAARRLDARGLVESLAVGLRAAIAEAGSPVAGVLLPPVLGLQSDEVLAGLSSLLGAPVGEAAAMLAPAGLRWSRRLWQRLAGRAERLRGRAEVTVDASGGSVLKVGGSRLRARAVVLATGGLYGGGIAYEARLREPCADAPVFLDDVERGASALTSLSANRGMDPVPLFGPTEAGSAGAARSGVRVDAQSRVVGLDGSRPLYPWLFGAGALLAGGAAPWGHPLSHAAQSGWRAGRCAAALPR